MECLVTGGAGFIGSNLVDFLIDNDHKVAIWDNLSTGKMENVNNKAYFKDVNISDEKLIIDSEEQLINRNFIPEVIFHLAAVSRIQPSFNNAIESYDSNVTGTINILEMAKRIKAKVIYASTGSIYSGVYDNPYTFTKYVGEEFCKLYNNVWNVPTVITRFFNVYGQRHYLNDNIYMTAVASFEKKFLDNEPFIIYGDGSKRRDFIHVEDVVKGIYAVSKKKYNGEIFNLGYGKNYSISEVALMFGNVDISYMQNRPGEAQESLADIEFTVKNLHWNPEKKLENYIKEFVKNSKKV